jgi:uncharacterized membrane protein YvlD (DUF360 family)
VNRIIGLLSTAASMYVAVWVVPGLDFSFAPEDAWWRFLLVAFIFGLVNSFVRPIPCSARSSSAWSGSCSR